MSLQIATCAFDDCDTAEVCEVLKLYESFHFRGYILTQCLSKERSGKFSDIRELIDNNDDDDDDDNNNDNNSNNNNNNNNNDDNIDNDYNSMNKT